jgi:hypothetical protein
MAVALEDVQNTCAACGNHQIIGPTSGEVSHGQKIWGNWHGKDTCFRQEGRRKLASANGSECSVALGRKRVQAAVMHSDNPAATGRGVTRREISNTISVEIGRDKRESDGLT